MRPIASTCVASMQNIAAPDSARLLMWVKCQSVAEPSTDEYWHIGDTMMRFARLRPRKEIGVKSVLMGMIRGKERGGGVVSECSGSLRPCQAWRGISAMP